MTDRTTGTAADADARALGARIRGYREARALSLRGLGEAAGASPGFLSQVERGLAGASIGMLRRIADALGLTMADLFDHSVPAGPRVVRRERRPALPTAPGTRKYLVSQRPLAHLEVYAGEFDPGTSTGEEAYTHGDSQEILLVLAGTVTVELDGHPYTLDAGDSLDYRTATPHRVANRSDAPAEVLWIVSPPTPD
ncbi:helix-turn-helix domain-containing protein [Kitasatospora sp. DSM 101779]|uniref:helix-turn-helix domain-containing protein n=1 Tax=Kitasatospora sp. DSM 101779 TaxID=2853165 RepID=UPI0021DB0132|nr:XRE family transcriptional regulator [Kitasatospora sp. DSM 101779]MCU7826208.1 XRE family transcriptional regulator [Kitasatospora sp. DSM 101779]